MLTYTTLEGLRGLKLHGMADAFEAQQAAPATHALAFEERFGLLVDRERLHRESQRRTRLLRGARLKIPQACIEDINYKAARGLDQRVDPAWPESADHGSDRVWKDLVNLCVRRTRLSPGALNPVLARAEAL